MHHSVDPSVPVRPQWRSPRPSRPTPRSVAGHARRSLAGAATALGIALTAVLGAPLSASAAAPTWQQVLEARGSEEAKQDALAEIAVAVEAASARADAAEGAAEAAGQVLGEAQAAVDEASAAHEALQAEAQQARADADDARLVVGHAAALLARPGGGGGLTSELMASGGDAEQVLRGLSMSTKLGENLAALRDRATTADRLATSLADQAAVALAERDRLVDEAQTALDEAAAASTAAREGVEQAEAEKATLAAQVALLHDDRLTLEQAYAKAEADRAAAAAAAAAATPPPAGARPGTGPIVPGPGVGPGAPGPGTTQPDPGTGWVAAIRSFSSYQAYGYRVHPITGEYKLHAGADFGASCGTPIYAVSAGRVTYAGPSSGYGNLVVVDHGGGVTSAYAHMERSGIHVSTGQAVGAGAHIASVGTAGGSTGCHLHLEVRLGGVATDPVVFLAGKGVR